VGGGLADATRLSLYLSVWGQTHQATARQDSRWSTEWRARSDLTVRQVQLWIQGVGDDGQPERAWTDHDLRVVKLGDWWWWVLDVQEPEGPTEPYPEGRPRRALLLSEGLVAILPYTESVDERGDGEFPGALWRDSSLRTWLKEDFTGRLPPDVTSRMVEERVSTKGWVEGAGDLTTETIYLLSPEEIIGDRAPYRFGMADVDAHTEGGLVGFWWLRSPGSLPNSASAVLPSALVVPVNRHDLFWVGSRAGLRPAFWLNLES
ncbi:MAG: DUF6273 domain-containing protein, partial [Cellulomonas sp.]|nr:DUF6273 domain-containing protein [Cellulomonas sp.]